SIGDVVLSIPRDRNSSFDPQLLPKHSRMSEELEDAIIGLYSRGMTTSDIEEQMRDIYGLSISAGTVSNVTNKLLVRIKEWQTRPLDKVYFTLWMDGIRVKVRHKGKILDKTVYLYFSRSGLGIYGGTAHCSKIQSQQGS
ncbi:MAG: transposase, partial [Bacteroidota bacterium]